mgnify:CR=1 FL=1
MMNDTKKFPYSEEAERYILGCMMLDPSIVDQVLTEITSNDFHVRANKNVMIAIETLSKNNVQIDQLTVYNELQRANTLEATGGIDYLYSLLDSVPSIANIEVYLNILHEKSLERKLLDIVIPSHKKITENIICYK